MVIAKEKSTLKESLITSNSVQPKATSMGICSGNCGSGACTCNNCTCSSTCRFLPGGTVIEASQEWRDVSFLKKLKGDMKN